MFFGGMAPLIISCIYPIELILKILFFRLDDEVNNLNYVEDSHYEFQSPQKVKL